MERKSGKHWVTWADTNAKNSQSLSDLNPAFKTKLESFKKALEDGGAKVKIRATRRNAKRAYLFHWSWKISLKKCTPCDPTAMEGVDIQWDHGNDEASIAAAKEMVKGFGLAIPPDSTVAPALLSNHIAGNAIDMDITWKGKICVRKKNGIEDELSYITNPNINDKLIAVGATYGVMKLKTDKPHWSSNGR